MFVESRESASDLPIDFGSKMKVRTNETAAEVVLFYDYVARKLCVRLVILFVVVIGDECME